MLVTAQREKEHTFAKPCLLYSIALSRTSTIAYNTAFAHLTEEEIAVDA